MSESDLGRIALLQGHYAEAITRMQEAIRLYRQVGDQALFVTEHMNLSFTLNAAGDHDEALETAKTGLQLAQESGDTYIVSALACNAAEACTHLDRLDEAGYFAMLALQQEEEFHRHYILTVQGVVLGKRGHHEQAAKHFIAAIQMAQACEDPFGEAPAWRWLALDYAQQGRFDEAREALASATALYQKMGQQHEIARNETLASNWVQAG
jgi:tetratricopeptide (TPR) repeat protein